MHDSRTTAPRVARNALLLAITAVLPACSTVQPPHAPQDWTALAPGLRIDRAARVVEFDATVAMDCHHPDTPDVYLELIACAPDTREHESLVVTTVPPSMIHAALLTIDAEPGAPASLRNGTPPTGEAVRVEFITDRDRPIDATDWIIDAPTRSRRPEHRFVFAGSRIATRTVNGEPREYYDADGTGVIIGLATFGSELIAYEPLINPDATIDEPVWIADPDSVPAIGRKVRVRITPLTAEPRPAP